MNSNWSYRQETFKLEPTRRFIGPRNLVIRVSSGQMATFFPAWPWNLKRMTLKNSIYIYIYISIHTNIHIYIYTFREYGIRIVGQDDHRHPIFCYCHNPQQTEMYTLKLLTWWRHKMETFSALLALCAGNSPVPVNSLHKGQWRGALMFSLICVWINDWVNNRGAGDLRRHHGHYDVNVLICW